MRVFDGVQFGFIFVITMFGMGRCVLYPSIQWTHLNALFTKNITHCVHPLSRLFFVCPNTVTIVTRQQRSYASPQYENLWLVSKQGFERCEVNKSMDRKLVVCDKPLNLNYYQVIFNIFSADSSAPLFKPGKDYYFIATSDGTKSSIDDISGGHCRTHNMKLKFHICANNTDPLCQNDDLCNGKVPTRPQTTANSTKPTTAAITTHTVKNTYFTNYTIPTTRRKTPGNPGNRSNMGLSESTYLITIGCLVFVCVLLLVVSVILICRLNRNRKATKAPPSSRNSDCPDGKWSERFPLAGVKSL